MHNLTLSVSMLPLQLESLIKIKDQLKNSKIRLNWESIRIIVTVLAPLERLTKEMQKEQYIAGDFLDSLLRCKHDLQLIADTNRGNATGNAAKEMLRALEERQHLILKNIQFLAAIYLDPRYINSANGNFLTPQEESSARVCI